MSWQISDEKVSSDSNVCYQKKNVQKINKRGFGVSQFKRELEKKLLWIQKKTQQYKTFSKTWLKYLSWTGDFLREVQLKAQKDQLDFWSTLHSPDQTGDFKLTEQGARVALHVMMMKTVLSHFYTESVAGRLKKNYIGKENVKCYIICCLMSSLICGN